VTHDIDEAVKLGDRIAILQLGGVLQQYDVPAEVLGRPATPMVADFVGSDRALKRLKVMPIDPAELEHPAGLDPESLQARVDVRTSLEDALAAILLTDDGVVGVVDGTRLLGTLTADAVARALRASRAAAVVPDSPTEAGGTLTH
jgi:osmoprotectant transport system ATP-binding protein